MVLVPSNESSFFLYYYDGYDSYIIIIISSIKIFCWFGWIWHKWHSLEGKLAVCEIEIPFKLLLAYML